MFKFFRKKYIYFGLPTTLDGGSVNLPKNSRQTMAENHDNSVIFWVVRACRSKYLRLLGALRQGYSLPVTGKEKI